MVKHISTILSTDDTHMVISAMFGGGAVSERCVIKDVFFMPCCVLIRYQTKMQRKSKKEFLPSHGVPRTETDGQSRIQSEKLLGNVSRKWLDLQYVRELLRN